MTYRKKEVSQFTKKLVVLLRSLGYDVSYSQNELNIVGMVTKNGRNAFAEIVIEPKHLGVDVITIEVMEDTKRTDAIYFSDNEIKSPFISLGADYISKTIHDYLVKTLGEY